MRDWREAVIEMGGGENERERCLYLTDRIEKHSAALIVFVYIHIFTQIDGAYNTLGG